MYKAIVEFYDLQDKGYKYRVGDSFPRPDFSVSDDRIAELLSNNNKMGKPLLEKVGKTKVEKKETTEVTNEDIKSMPFFSLKAEAKKRGIDVEGKKAAQLREELLAEG